MKMYKWLILWGCLLLTACSYLQKNDSEQEVPGEKNESFTEAKILYTGPVEADGLGYVVQVGTTSYIPENLPAAFKVNDLSVSVKYKLTGKKFTCFCATYPDIIHIEDIRRR